MSLEPLTVESGEQGRCAAAISNAITVCTAFEPDLTAEVFVLEPRESDRAPDEDAG
jgi:hypothetical protein